MVRERKVEREKTIRRFQAALISLGFYKGKIDGILGPSTIVAITDWGKVNAFSFSGDITPALLSLLEFKVAELIKSKQEAVSEQKRKEPRIALAAKQKQKEKERRIALVIGNSSCKNSPLANPVNDARLMTTTLRKLGFDVLERLNVDWKGMKKAVRDFGDRVEKAGPTTTGLFYYAGHAVQVAGKNYLIPLGASIDGESDVDIEALHANAVLTKMEYARNNLNIVIMDACRNNPYARSFRSPTRGLARMKAPKGTLIAYSTAPGDVAVDGTGSNSPYTEALVKHMAVPGVPVEIMFKAVRNSVIEATNKSQVPWEASSLTGDFYFTVH